MMKILKKSPRITYFLLALSLCFIGLSCEKEEMEPELVPKTTTGENTIGFYVDGKAVNITGEWEDNWGLWTNINGVTAGTKNSGETFYIYADEEDPWDSDESDYSLSIFIPYDSIDNTTDEFILNDSIDNIKIAELDNNNGPVDYYYRTEPSHTGKITFTRMEEGFSAGTFSFDLVHPESRRVIKIRDGRFDIKWN